jgi:hypothetical protein
MCRMQKHSDRTIRSRWTLVVAAASRGGGGGRGGGRGRGQKPKQRLPKQGVPPLDDPRCTGPVDTKVLEILAGK